MNFNTLSKEDLSQKVPVELATLIKYEQKVNITQSVDTLKPIKANKDEVEKLTKTIEELRGEVEKYKLLTEDTPDTEETSDVQETAETEQKVVYVNDDDRVKVFDAEDNARTRMTLLLEMLEVTAEEITEPLDYKPSTLSRSMTLGNYNRKLLTGIKEQLGIEHIAMLHSGQDTYLDDIERALTEEAWDTFEFNYSAKEAVDGEKEAAKEVDEAPTPDDDDDAGETNQDTDTNTDTDTSAVDTDDTNDDDDADDTDDDDDSDGDDDLNPDDIVDGIDDDNDLSDIFGEEADGAFEDEDLDKMLNGYPSEDIETL